MSEILLALSMLSLAGSCLAWRQLRRSEHLKKGSVGLTECLIAGTFLAGVFLHFPMYFDSFRGQILPVTKSLAASAHHTLRTFILDGEMDPIVGFAGTIGGAAGQVYEIWGMLLYLLAPVLTFSAVLSLLRNVSAYRRMLARRFEESFFFSELNEQSLSLAKSLRKNHPKALLAFTDVYDTGGEEIAELCGRARELDALMFSSDIADLDLHWHRSGQITFFVIGGDETENIQQALSLTRQYGHNPKTKLYIFSSSVESELLFQTSEEGGMVVHRVNITRALINQTLYRRGIELFQKAVPTEGGKKLISAVVLGMGQYGSEMIKALCWCGQMDGYDIEIHAFDLRPDAAERFTAQCPELMEFSGRQVEGEARYLLCLHPGVDAESYEPERILQGLPHITHVFVGLGSDAENIRAGVRLRELCERRGEDATIQVVVHDSRKVENLAHIHDYKGKPYRIEFIGDLDTSYSEEVVLGSELEKAALARHLRWGAEKDFWAFEYNYQSSVASAIHQRLRFQCGMPGAGKKPEERTVEETLALCRMEHMRWNAFMRGEGYRYSGSHDEKTRNTLAKLHNDLIPFDQLSPDEQIKDDI